MYIKTVQSDSTIGWVHFKQIRRHWLVLVTAPLLLLYIGHLLCCVSAMRNLYQWDLHGVKSHTYSRIRPQIFFGSSYHLFTE